MQNANPDGLAPVRPAEMSNTMHNVAKTPQSAAARAAVLALTRSDLRVRLYARAGALGETALLSLVAPDVVRDAARSRGIPENVLNNPARSHEAFRDLLWELAEERATAAALALSTCDLDDGASWRRAYDAATGIASFVVYEDCDEHMNVLFDAELVALIAA